MKRKLFVLLALVVVLSLVIVVPVGAKKPAPKLVGQMDLSLTVPVFNDDGDLVHPGNVIPGCYGEGTAFTWRGTVTFEELAGDFGMVSINLGTGKAFDEARGSVSFFEEIWAIYDGPIVLETNPETGCPDIDEAVIWGYDSGVSNLSNNTYRMNADVEFAEGPFLGWEGRKGHMSGTFDFGGFPDFVAPGTFRLN